MQPFGSDQQTIRVAHFQIIKPPWDLLFLGKQHSPQWKTKRLFIIYQVQ